LTPDPQLRSHLAAIREPQLVRTLAELGFLGEVDESGGAIRVELVLPVTNWPHLETLRASVFERAPGADVVVRTMNDDERLALRNFLRGAMAADAGPGEHDHGDASPRFLDKLSKTRVLGISSGKGGVGKSSVTVNLAIALALTGHSVGVLDADVYGFSLPKMLGATNDPIVLGDTVIPTLVHGVRCLSMGYFVDDAQPVIWRGPMLHKAIEQLVTEAWWDEPDFLLIDMPPGTGDVALTLSEILPRIEMYVVTTPQAAAQRVAQRSAYAARKLKLSVRGVSDTRSLARVGENNWPANWASRCSPRSLSSQPCDVAATKANQWSSLIQTARPRRPLSNSRHASRSKVLLGSIVRNSSWCSNSRGSNGARR
jgi:ATP-binding protein involved in chromosome partitioning